MLGGDRLDFLGGLLLGGDRLDFFWDLDPFIMKAAVMEFRLTKVEKKSEGYAGCAKIIEDLCHVLIPESFRGFNFEDDPVFDQNIGKV